MIDFTFLTIGQIFGKRINEMFDEDYARRLVDEELDILKIYGTKCAITDFSILLGGAVLDKDFTSEGVSLKNRVGHWWSSIYSIAPGPDAYCVRAWNDSVYASSVFSSYVGGRPATSYSSISCFCPSPKKRLDNGILEIEFGEYPQDIVSLDYAMELENAYLNGTIKETGKIYTTDTAPSNKKYNHFLFIQRSHIEYEYEGRKYIRIVGDEKSAGVKLSDGRKIKKDEAYWISVQPIKWMIDKKTDILLSKKILFAGMPFGDKHYELMGPEYKMKHPRAYYFKYSTMKRFMDKYFSKDIIDDRLAYINENKKIDEIEDNIKIKSDLKSFIYKNIRFELFDELNKITKKRDSFISCMEIVFDSDSYHEMSSKLNLMKDASLAYENGNKKEALELIKEIDSDKHKEIFNDKIVSYPKSSINQIDKPKRIIDRMKYLYSRIEPDCDYDFLDTLHDNSNHLKDLCNKVDRYKLGQKVKRKVKSLFVK